MSILIFMLITLFENEMILTLKTYEILTRVMSYFPWNNYKEIALFQMGPLN